jgi:hypothetical protein
MRPNLTVRAPGHVRREGEDLRAQRLGLLGDRADGIFAAGVDHDARPLPPESERERPAETLARAGDHGDLAFEHDASFSDGQHFRYWLSLAHQLILSLQL